MSWLLLPSAYLIGSIPWALIVVFLRHRRNVLVEGSGNVGARNALRTGGKLAGALVLALDILKGATPPLLARLASADALTVALCGVLVVAGHCFSLPLVVRSLRMAWPGWRDTLMRVGGMGLASAFGVLLVLAPWIALAVIVVGVFLTFGPKWNLGTALAMISVAVLLAWLLELPQATSIGISLMAVVITLKYLPDIFPAPSA